MLQESTGTVAEKPLVYVDDSGIHGRGLFAGRFIAEGEVIGIVQGRETQEDGAYVLWIDEEQAVEVTCNLRYINHSDNPNAAYYDTLEVCALTDIQPGEEITHNYVSDHAGEAGPDVLEFNDCPAD